MKHAIRLKESDLRRLVTKSVKGVLYEGYLNDICMTDNFRKWFNGSKIVDDNGRPLLLGHATRSFGFNKFKTPYIHLSTINDASYFSGGNKRMFRFKKTLNKMSDEEILDIYNKYFKYSTDEDLYLLTDESVSMIVQKYELRLSNIREEYADYYSNEEIQEEIDMLNTCKNILLKQYNRYGGKLCCRPSHKGMPRLTPKGFVDRSTNNWFMDSFPSIAQLRKEIFYKMFEKDDKLGKGGTYALCARVLNPFVIDCHWNPWDRITISPENEAYDAFYDMYCNYGLNQTNLRRGSWLFLDNETIAEFAKELGYDGVIFKRIKEGAYGNVKMDTTYIVYSTKQLKSPFENNGDFGDVENIFK